MNLRRALYLVAMLLALSACTPRAAVKESHALVPVFFATDRLEVSADEGWFGVRRHESSDGHGVMTYGRAEVSIPASHRAGEFEEPSLWSLEFTEDPGKHVTIAHVEPLEKFGFFTQVKAQVDHRGVKRALVFIHGYNVSFDHALRRAAQISYDLRYPGPPLLFSWPSRGTLSGYVRDLNDARWATADLENFLLDVATKSGATQVDIIAHSMGNQPLIEALQDLSARHAPVHFRQIIMAAPDMDTDMFRRAAAGFIGEATRVTLYASSNDEALKASKSVNGYPRAGDASDGILVAPGVDTIDASAADTSLLGHSYYGDAKSVLSDIDNILRTDDPPGNRPHLSPALTNGARYWRYVP